MKASDRRRVMSASSKEIECSKEAVLRTINNVNHTVCFVSRNSGYFRPTVHARKLTVLALVNKEHTGGAKQPVAKDITRHVAFALRIRLTSQGYLSTELTNQDLEILFSGHFMEARPSFQHI